MTTTASARGSRLSASTSRSAYVMTGASSYRPNARLENTYRMEPTRGFPVAQAKHIVEETLEARLGEIKYMPEDCQKLSMEIANIIKAKVKSLSCPRYKVVAFVVIGEKKLATMNFVSRCAWNPAFDTFIEGAYDNGSLYATGTVYAVYQE